MPCDDNANECGCYIQGSPSGAVSMSVSGSGIQSDPFIVNAVISAAPFNGLVALGGSQPGLWTPSAAITGEIRMFGNVTPPNGWLACNGGNISRSVFSALFGVIGTTYGSGDGVSTFTLPDFNGRVPMGFGQRQGGSTSWNMGDSPGEENHGLLPGEIPGHTHGLTALGYYPTGGSPTGAGQGVGTVGTGGAIPISQTTDEGPAGNSPSVGTPHNNMQPSLVVLFIIKA